MGERVRTMLALVALALVAAAFFLMPHEAALPRALLAGAGVAALLDALMGFFQKSGAPSKDARHLFNSMRVLQIGEFLSYVLYQLREYLITVTSIVEQLALTPAKDQPGVGEKLERLRKVVGELNVKAARLLGDQAAVTTRSGGGRSSFAIPDVVDRCVNAARELYGSEIASSIVVEGELPAVSGDRRALQAGLMAVLQNAFEACAAKGSGRVTVTVRKHENRAQIEVTDEGGGVEAAPEGLFEPLHSARAGSDGLGLGLSMGRRLMERTGGTLRLKSKPPYTAALLEFPLGGDLPFVRNEESTWAGRRDKI